MISLSQCAAYAGLDSSELLIGAVASAKHHSLLESYVLNLRRGDVVVRDLIRTDLRTFIDLGAQEKAADLLLVLRLFLSGYPEARHGDRQSKFAERILKLADLGVTKWQSSDWQKLPLMSDDAFEARMAAAIDLEKI
jgi:hypothetical protein